MKYGKLYPANCNTDHLTIELLCSECDEVVNINDKYCSRCGHKLNPLNYRIYLTTLTDVINENVDRFQL